MLARVQRLLDERIIREVTPIFDTRALGYCSMLVAAKVDPEHPYRAAKVINSHPGVIAQLPAQPRVQPVVHDRRRAGLEARPRRARSTCSQELTGAESIRQLPTLKLFKIRMDLEMEGGTEALARPPARRASRSSSTKQPYDEFDIAVDPRHAGRHAGRPRALRRPPPRELGITVRTSCSSTSQGMQRARPAAPRRRDPLPPPRRLLGQRHGRLGGARGPDPRDRPARWPPFRGISPLLPAPDLRRLALLGLHDGPRPLEGGVRRDPRRDRARSTGIEERATLYSLHRVQEDPAALLHRRLQALGARARGR